jgi:hypothetical protein
MDMSGIPANVRQNVSGIIIAIYIQSLKMINLHDPRNGEQKDIKHMPQRETR